MRATRYSAVQTNKQSAVQSRSLLLLLHDKNGYVCTKSEKYVHSRVEEKEQYSVLLKMVDCVSEETVMCNEAIISLFETCLFMVNSCCK